MLNSNNISIRMFKNKKGFGSVVSTLIMFIAIVGVSTGLVIAFKGFMLDTQSSMRIQNDITNKQLQSAISISNIVYNSSNNKLYVYVKNIGTITHTPKLYDVFLDDLFTNKFNYTYADNFSKVITIFQPQDTMVLIINATLGSGTHSIKVVSEYSTIAKDLFNV